MFAKLQWNVLAHFLCVVEYKMRGACLRINSVVIYEEESLVQSCSLQDIR